MNAIDPDELGTEDLVIEVTRTGEPVGEGVVTTIWIEGRTGKTTFATAHLEAEEKATASGPGERGPAQVQVR